MFDNTACTRITRASTLHNGRVNCHCMQCWPTGGGSRQQVPWQCLVLLQPAAQKKGCLLPLFLPPSHHCAIALLSSSPLPPASSSTAGAGCCSLLAASCFLLLWSLVQHHQQGAATQQPLILLRCCLLLLAAAGGCFSLLIFLIAAIINKKKWQGRWQVVDLLHSLHFEPAFPSEDHKIKAMEQCSILLSLLASR